jgi:hypothetical protein
MGGLAWLVVALVAGFAAQSQAQVPLTIACNDRSGRAVTPVQVTNGIIAIAKVDQDGRPVVEYDQRPIAGISPQQRLFVYAHECGHLALGHDRGGQSTNLTQEQNADCYAIRSLMNKVGFTANDISILQAFMQQLGADAARYLPWPKRVYNLDGCLANDTSDGGTARGNRSGEASADDCVLHRDAANAILDETRDGRTIKGLYAAANRCARDVTCTFTIETGTLPEADVAIDSWSHFRRQKTRTEEHILKAGAEMEFRFDETIDNVPTNESVDFRVLKACR